MGVCSHTRRFLAAVLTLCAALLMTAALLPPQASAEEATQATTSSTQKVVRVGLFEDTYHKVNDKGELYGYGYEYLQKIAGYEGWTIEYVEADWYTCFDKLESGEIDILNGISYTSERARSMLFSTLPMAEERYFIYADARNRSISSSDLSSIDGKTVGVMVGAVPEDVLNSWEADNGVTTTHTDITTAEDVLTNLNAGAMDCFVSVEETWDEDYVQPVMYIGDSDVYFAVNKNRSDLKADLDSAMARITNDDPFYNDELYEKYFSSSAAAALTSAERTWIDGHGPIRVGFIIGDVNIGEVDATTGEVSGIITDYIGYASNCLEDATLEFETHGYDSMEDELNALAAGEIDMIFKVPFNPHYVEQYNLSLSDTTLDIPYSAVSLPGHFDQQGAVTVAIPRGNWVKTWYIENCYPTWTIVDCDSVEDAQRMVCEGKADCFLTRTGRSREYIKNSSYQVNMLDNDIAMSFGVRREDATLLSILNKTIKAMPADLLSNALTAYDNESYNVTLVEYVRDNLGEVVPMVSVVVLLLAGSFYAWRKTKADARRQKETDEAYQRELLAAKQDAELANATKTDFLRRMSHDIRTPINGIRGMVQIANSNLEDPEKLEDCSNKIWKSTDHLLALVNDVLDMNKLESGQFTVRHDPFSLIQVLDEVHAIAEPQAQEHGVQFIAQNTGEVEHDRLIGSPVYLQRIFTNFVGNAIKYNRPGGTVCVHGHELSFDGTTAWYEFVCEDTGIGMSEEFLAHAFETFTQEEQTQARTVYAGTGLGLAISKSLIELLGGTVELTSRLGEGTKVVFRLPFEVDQEPELLAEECADCSDAMFEGARALLVEDNELNAEIATFMLEQHGLSVTWVENGQLAVDVLAKDSAAFDVVFMDIMMPVMDGLDATRAIREELYCNIPIFAMTANAFTDDAQRSLDAGMNEHLTKPLREEEIVLALYRHLCMPEEGTPGGTPEEDSSKTAS